ncbi:MAG: pyruvate kinase, partial [Gemmatimonadales bacterium]
MSYDPRFRRTKIVATIGPGSANEATIRAMVEAGVNVFRVNSSHGTADQRAGLMELVHEIRTELGRYVGLLLDLQGPRIRVGRLDQPVELVEGEEVVFAPGDRVTPGDIPTTYHDLARDVEVKSRVLLDDGLLVVEVIRCEGDRVIGTVVHGGLLNSNKGMNLPGVRVSAPAVTEKDREDIELGIAHHVDFVGISFVRRAADVMSVRELIPDSIRLVAKIEKAEALADLEGIVDASDAIMVARGDLGVELPF